VTLFNEPLTAIEAFTIDYRDLFKDARLYKRFQATITDILASGTTRIGRTLARAVHAMGAYTSIVTYFSHASAAKRYASARPYFHPKAVGLLIEATKQVHFSKALDVACGTGMGTKALLEVCDEVVGCDISAEMLAVARDEVRDAVFLQAPAENLPLEDASVDLVTTFLALHWFDQTQFFREAYRVLKPGGYFMICNHWSKAKLRDRPEFKLWADGFYANYPAPPRNAGRPELEASQGFGFEKIAQQTFEDEFMMNAEEMAAFISSQSNVIAKVEHGEESLEHVLSTITTGVTEMLGTQKGAFHFGGEVWILRRRPA
jgi:ubiquinone/menaquinone biosynthesis C-methylase UbiE